MLWGGSVPHPEVFGYSPVAFAANLLAARGDSLKGKRCLVTGSGKVALAVAERLVAVRADNGGGAFEMTCSSVERACSRTSLRRSRWAPSR